MPAVFNKELLLQIHPVSFWWIGRFSPSIFPLLQHVLKYKNVGTKAHIIHMNCVHYGMQDRCCTQCTLLFPASIPLYLSPEMSHALARKSSQ